MNYLYSLYDVLVSISVPADKARAVVDAMEREMGTTLATKQDLSLLAARQDGLATRQDLVLLRQEVAGIRTEIKQDLASVRTELKQEIENRYALLDQKIDTMQLGMIVKLGSMLIVGFGLTIAAIRMWM
jgi:hypothetical protein